MNLRTCLPAFSLLLLGAGGCASGNRDDASAMSAASVPGHTEAEMAGLSTAEQVELRYVVGPAAARKLGYRIDWQLRSPNPLKLIRVVGDAVLTLDDHNVLTMAHRDNGDRAWRVPVVDAVEQVFGVNYIPSVDRVYVTTGSSIVVLDGTSGAHVGRQKLTKTANTAPVRIGPFLVYGSRDGQLVWHTYLPSSDWRAYKISPSIQVPPVYADGYVVTIGIDGRIMCLVANSASQVWSKKALGPIVSTPVAGNGAVFVSSLDQFVRGYELGQHRSPLWEYLTESPLSEPPVLIGDRVYQQVPSQGLVCLEAQPYDSPGGVVIWETADARGNVITRTRRSLLTWDDASKQLMVIDPRLGAVIDTLDMPQVQELLLTDVDNGDLYATGHDGRLTRLVPR